MLDMFSSKAFAYVTVLGVIVLVVLHRYLLITCLPYLKRYFQDGPWGDSISYLYLTQFFRDHKSGVPDERSLITSNPVYFPSLYLKWAGKSFSDTQLIRYPWLPNYILYAACATIFGVWLIFHYGIENYQAIVFTLLLFLVQADNIVVDRHRIHFVSYQPRFFGVCALSLYWLLYIFADGPVYWIIKVFLIVLCLNSSLFARQAILFVSLLACTFGGDLELIVNILVASIVSHLIFPTEFLDSLRTQVKYAWWYFNNYYKPAKSGAVAYAIKSVFSRPMLQGIIYFDFWTIIFVILARPELVEGAIGSSSAERVRAFYLALFVVFVVTGLRKFASLGECWRYISFCTYFLSPVLLGELADSFGLSGAQKAIALLLLLTFNGAMCFVAKKDSNESRQLIDLIAQYVTELEKSIWYGVPYRVATLPVVKGVGIKTFEFQYGNMDIKTMKDYFTEYPYLKPSKDLMRSHGVTHLLIDKTLTKGLRKDFAVNLDDPVFSLVGQNDNFAIYRMAPELPC